MLSKRQFLKNALGLAALAAAGQAAANSSAPQQKTAALTLQISSIVGKQYYDFEKVQTRLQLHEPLILKREPQNRHDINAIAVYFINYKLGYIAKSENYALAQLMDTGHKIKAEISYFHQGQDPWESDIRMNIQVEK